MNKKNIKKTIKYLESLDKTHHFTTQLMLTDNKKGMGIEGATYMAVNCPKMTEHTNMYVADIAKISLSLSSTQAIELFSPSNMYADFLEVDPNSKQFINKDRAIAQLKNLIKIGEVNWNDSWYNNSILEADNE